MRKKKGITIIGLLLVLVIGSGAIIQTSDKYFQIAKNMEIFAKLYREVNEQYVDKPNPTRLMRTSIEAMLQTLDPYTNFYSESEIEDAKFLRTGQYSGIGVQLRNYKEGLFIQEIRENSPADKSGLTVGDKITFIEKEAVEGKSIEEVEELLNGESGTTVNVTILRYGETLEESVPVSRENTVSKNVPYQGIVNSDIGYIQLTGFEENAGLEVAEAAKKLAKENPNLKGYILDLRGNLGGRVDEAVNVANTFISKGEKIVDMRGRTQESQRSFGTRKDPVDTERPLAVLIDRRSASASEIVAGAIQDLDRGVIIGQRSFGKGLVQNVRPLSFNTQMKITIAKYYTPSGRCIQAIDYYNRNEDGSVGYIADSLQTAFSTKNGRTVYDGGGIDPDVEVKPIELQPVSRELVNQGIVFDFINRYYLEHTEKPSVADFEITDALFKDFTKYVAPLDFQFETTTDRALKMLKDSLAKGDYLISLQAEISNLEKELSTLKAKDLFTHQKEISRILRQEIIKRYHYRKGMLFASFRDNPDVQTAVEVLNDSPRYKEILRDTL